MKCFLDPERQGNIFFHSFNILLTLKSDKHVTFPHNNHQNWQSDLGF